MKKTILFTTLFLNFALLFAQGDYDLMYPGMEYEVGTEVRVFGHNTKLRSAPNTEGEVLTLINIGERVEILEKAEETYSFYGFDSPWYKINYGGETGYVVGGLLAMGIGSYDGLKFVFNYKKEGEKIMLLTRMLGKEHTYTEYQYELDVTETRVRVDGNRGIEGVENIVTVSYVAEACGVNGGGFYLFSTKPFLSHEIS